LDPPLNLMKMTMVMNWVIRFLLHRLVHER